MKKKTKKFGFTLVEILLTVTIIAFIGTAIYNVFSQGLKIWKMAQRASPELDMNLLFEKMTSELRNAAPYSGNAMVGGADSIEFYRYQIERVPTATQKGKDSTLFPDIKRIKYMFNRSKQTIEVVQEKNIALTNSVLMAQEPRTLINQVVNCQFQYFLYDTASQTYSWNDYWQKECFPLAVKAKVDYRDLSKVKSVTYIISVPAGGCAKS